MRQIDADALKAEWYKINDIGPEDCGARFVGYQEIARLIDNAPTVEPGGDYISRANAIRWVKTECNPYGKPTLDYDSGLKVIEHLKKMPSELPSAEAIHKPDYSYEADMVRRLKEALTERTGEWLEVEVFPEVYDIKGVKTWGSEMQCDQCGFRHTAIEGHMAQYNFCPNCGARMKGGAE